MRISYLATIVLAVCFLPLSAPAFANCSSTSCSSSGKTITYGSGSYGARSTSTKHRSSTHVSSGINTRYGITSAAACPSGATRARNGVCISGGNSSAFGVSRSTAYASNATYGSSRSSSFRSTGKVVPFTTTVSKISNYRVAGMGANEFLSPTACPVSVYNPGGHEVLGCYSVVKPVQVVRPVPQIRHQQIRVVRPIIYVRYPVPTPMPMPMPVCRTQSVCGGGCSSTTYSRYGNTWPQGGNNCGRWY